MSDDRAVAVAKVAQKWGITEKAVLVLAANNLLPKFIDAKTALLITGKPKQHVAVREIVADTTQSDAPEFGESHLHEHVFGYADLSISERKAVLKNYKGQRLAADRVHAILSKLSN